MKPDHWASNQTYHPVRMAVVVAGNLLPYFQSYQSLQNHLQNISHIDTNNNQDKFILTKNFSSLKNKIKKNK